VVLIAVLAVAALTNPGMDAFRDHIRKEVRRDVGTFGEVLFGGITAEVYVGSTKRINLLVCSVYKTDISEEDELRLGAFGTFWGPL
jgi:hypothetical protein